MRAELRQAMAQRLSDPELRMPDGTAYDDEVLEQVRKRIPREGESAELPRPELQPQYLTLRMEMINAQRAELLRLRDLGTYSTALLSAALDQLDADQIGIELRGES